MKSRRHHRRRQRKESHRRIRNQTRRIGQDAKDRDSKSKDGSEKSSKASKESRKERHEKPRETSGSEGKVAKDSTKSQNNVNNINNKQTKENSRLDPYLPEGQNNNLHELDGEKKFLESDDSEPNESSSLRLTPESSPFMNSARKHQKDGNSCSDAASEDEEEEIVVEEEDFTAEDLEEVADNGFKVKILCSIMHIINESQNRELVQKVANLASADTKCFVENGHFKFDLMNVSTSCMRKIQEAVNKCTDNEEEH